MPSRLTASLPTSLLLTLLAACVPPPVQVQMPGALTAEDERLEQDGSAFDTYRFVCRHDEVLDVRLSSDEFDPYVFLILPDGTTIADDDSGSGWNASLTAVVPVTGGCAVVATSYAPRSFGRYLVEIFGTR